MTGPEGFAEFCSQQKPRSCNKHHPKPPSPCQAPRCLQMGWQSRSFPPRRGTTGAANRDSRRERREVLPGARLPTWNGAGKQTRPGMEELPATGPRRAQAWLTQLHTRSLCCASRPSCTNPRADTCGERDRRQLLGQRGAGSSGSAGWGPASWGPTSFGPASSGPASSGSSKFQSRNLRVPNL